MAPVVDRRRSYPSAALSALFGPAERWGWTLEVPQPFQPSSLRTSPPVPRAGEDYAVAYQQWREQIESDEAAARRQASTVATWSSRRPHEEYALAAVFGGTVTGWHALVTTLGGSILGSGSRLTIVNLSERAVTQSLRTLARRCGYRVRIDTVAPAKSSLDLISYVGQEQLIDFMVDVIHHDEEQTSSDAREDRAVLRAVAATLTGAATCARLQAGLRVLLRESGPPSSGDILSTDEFQRLSALFGEQRRQHTDVIARASRLDHELAEFVALEHSGRLAPPESAPVPEDLRVIEAWRTPDRLDFDFSVRLLIEAVLRRVTRGESALGRQVFLIAGADRLNRRLIRSFSDLAEQGRVQFVMLLAHLTDETRDILSSAKAVIAFMRLTDQREAAQASDFIGTAKKFVVSQTTRTRGESYEQSRGHSSTQERAQSHSRGPDFGRTIGESASRSEGTNTGSSRGESFTASETDQLTEERITEPHIFQSLPETGLLLVNLQTREPVFADCDPTLVIAPA